MAASSFEQGNLDAEEREGTTETTKFVSAGGGPVSQVETKVGYSILPVIPVRVDILHQFGNNWSRTQTIGSHPTTTMSA